MEVCFFTPPEEFLRGWFALLASGVLGSFAVWRRPQSLWLILLVLAGLTAVAFSRVVPPSCLSGQDRATLWPPAGVTLALGLLAMAVATVVARHRRAPSAA